MQSCSLVLVGTFYRTVPENILLLLPAVWIQKHVFASDCFLTFLPPALYHFFSLLFLVHFLWCCSPLFCSTHTSVPVAQIHFLISCLSSVLCLYFLFPQAFSTVLSGSSFFGKHYFLCTLFSSSLPLDSFFPPEFIYTRNSFQVCPWLMFKYQLNWQLSFPSQKLDCRVLWFLSNQTFQIIPSVLPV